MQVIMLLILLQFNLSKPFNINENLFRIKSILNTFKSNLTHISDIENATYYIEKTLSFLKESERYAEFLKYYDASACTDTDGKNISSYTKRHIMHGLIVDPSVPEIHWYEYKAVFKKRYYNEKHERAAKKFWRDNLKLIADHNKNYLRGSHSYTLHLNFFGDMHPNDYIKKLLKLITTIPLFDPAEDRRKTTFNYNRHLKVPTHIDWREKGYRPTREEQWRCGACYAFAVSHAIQAQMFIKNRRWRELSPQQIVDCSGVDGNLGCDGGSLRATLRYAAREGLQTELEYPYIGKKNRCRYNRKRVKVLLRRWAMLPFGNEWAIEKALANIGPLAVGVNASPRSFQLYRSGIYDDPLCTPFTVNHAMLLVGYTPEYWILLNWWGRKWGEDGYIRIRRGFNICGVANMATYVEIL